MTALYALLWPLCALVLSQLSYLQGKRHGYRWGVRDGIVIGEIRERFRSRNRSPYRD